MSFTANTCPVPGNINPLYLTAYQFSVAKLPEITFFVKQAEVPSISLGVAPTANRNVQNKLPGETLEFTDLSVTFAVDQEMNNWNAVYFWMVGLGFPKNHQQYRDFLQYPYNKNLFTEASKGYSDGTLVVMDNNNQPKQIFEFIDLFPINLTGLQWDSTSNEPRPAEATVTFAYTYYKINKTKPLV